MTQEEDSEIIHHGQNEITSHLNNNKSSLNNENNIDISNDINIDTNNGNRKRILLQDSSNIWNHNAWDSVEWTESQKLHAQQVISNHYMFVSNNNLKIKNNNENECNNNNFDSNNNINNNEKWNKFYTFHDRYFFKDRKWLQIEFPELFPYSHHKEKNAHNSHTSNDNNEISFNLRDGNNKRNPIKILEVGCGAGNTLFPILREYKKNIKINSMQREQIDKQHEIEIKSNNNDNSINSDNSNDQDNKFLWGCDFSSKALELIQSFREYDSNLMHIFQYDLTSGNNICTRENLNLGHNDEDNDKNDNDNDKNDKSNKSNEMNENIMNTGNDNNSDNESTITDATLSLQSQSSLSLSLFNSSSFFDIIVMIFVLSAIPPVKVSICLRSLLMALKPGGILLYRDYGLYDLTQLRFKAEQCIDKNFYTRGDGTFSYYRDEEETRQLFLSHGFECIECKTDSRLVVNRLRKLQMHRIWIQGRFKRPLTI